MVEIIYCTVSRGGGKVGETPNASFLYSDRRETRVFDLQRHSAPVGSV